MTVFNLGTYHRPVRCEKSEAQSAFDRGLVWLYGYNHEAAAAEFGRAQDIDPTCALAGWGVAYALGPNYNHTWDTFTEAERIAATERGREALATAQATVQDPAERALLEAVRLRLPASATLEDFTPHDAAYAEAMRNVRRAFPDDLDIAALTAEALMVCTPWALWDTVRGVPADEAHTAEARDILDDAFARLPGAWEHPGLLHMYVHLMEMSPWPELALRHGDALCGLVPDSGHLEHMATHIDLLCGEYQNVVARNRRAAEVDRHYKSAHGGENFYTLYRLHNLHFETYGAMFLAQPSAALRAANALADEVPDEVVRVYPDLFEAFHATRAHVYVRFGLWEAALAETPPADSELYAFTQAVWAYAHTVALANLGRLSEAETTYADFAKRYAAMPNDRKLFQNTARDVLGIADAMAQGELAFNSGRRAEGLDHLRTAVARDDALLYEEPWAWMQPARHALGALLMEAGDYNEAEAVYRADLGLDDTLPRPCQHPGNVWALHGLEECLARRGETVERPHIAQQLARAAARAEIPIRASCACRQVA